MLSQVPTLSPLSSLDRRACRGLWAHENMQSVSGMSNKYCLNITCSPMYFDENHRESTTSHCSSPGMVLVTASWVSMGLHGSPWVSLGLRAPPAAFSSSASATRSARPPPGMCHGPRLKFQCREASLAPFKHGLTGQRIFDNSHTI